MDKLPIYVTKEEAQQILSLQEDPRFEAFLAHLRRYQDAYRDAAMNVVVGTASAIETFRFNQGLANRLMLTVRAVFEDVARIVDTSE